MYTHTLPYLITEKKAEVWKDTVAINLFFYSVNYIQLTECTVPLKVIAYHETLLNEAFFYSTFI